MFRGGQLWYGLSSSAHLLCYQEWLSLSLQQGQETEDIYRMQSRLAAVCGEFVFIVVSFNRLEQHIPLLLVHNLCSVLVQKEL